MGHAEQDKESAALGQAEWDKLGAMWDKQNGTD